MDSLQRLQGLHADLQAFTETRLANIDRLWQELEGTVQEFRLLLDKPTSTSSERDAYNSGKIAVDDQEYSINDEFRHMCRAIGTVLDLDEVEAGKLLVQGSNSSAFQDDYLVADAVGRYHDRRDLLIQSLRITLQEALNDESEDAIRNMFRDIVAHILNIATGPPSNGSAFAIKCLKAMEDVETRTMKVNEQIQSKAVLNQARGAEFYATLDFQKGSLFKQHEALGAVVALLFRGNYTISEDLRKLHSVVKRWQRLDLFWIHYLPAFSAAFGHYGGPERSTSQQDAKSLNSALISSAADNSASQARPLLAVLDLWWTVEYSGWFREPVTHDNDEKRRMEVVKTALNDHALEFLLFVCSSSNMEMWRHLSRHELIDLLIGDRSTIAMDIDQPTSSFFYTMLMESIEAFAESWITNMPDSIRKLKNEEDDQRLLQLTADQDGMLNSAQRDHVGRLHLESFLVIIAFAFEQRPDAAESFWSDPDGNLYGFLQWTSKRQTVPRVSAFCEMLCAISESPGNAKNAHTFLLDESTAVPSSRMRRVPTMNYQQIFAELELYAKKVHEKNSTTQLPRNGNQVKPELNEAESPVMLSCYLRLIAYLCREYQPTRQYIFNSVGFDLPRTLLLLASGPVPSYLRASVFRTLEALLSDKDSNTSEAMWKTVDEWASSTHDSAAMLQAKQNPSPVQSLGTLLSTLTSISQSFDQYDAFTDLLRALIAPIPTTIMDGLSAPAPRDLGSSYRDAGMLPYVDFICGLLYVKRIRELADDGQAQLCSFHCLDFVACGLEGFNESYVTMVDRTSTQQDSMVIQNEARLYAQRHPFARLMQWLFSTDMSRMMLNMLHGRIEDVEAALSDGPAVLNLLRCIDVINLILDLQPTYFDIVKPTVKDLTAYRGVSSAGVSSFEETVVGHIEIIVDLCKYAATSHLQLSLRSLALLQKLTSSPKLNNYFMPNNKDRPCRLIDMIGQNTDIALEPVANALAQRLQIDVRELEDGFESPGYLMKDGILAFMNAALSFDVEAPNIAHLLLGFGRIGDRLTISPLIDSGTSLMNATVDLALEYPDGQDGGLVSWLIHLKSAAMRVLQSLWSSSVSSEIVLGQLKRFSFLTMHFTNQSVIHQNTVWDGKTIADPDFWYTTSAEALTEFLIQRSCLYDYAAKELACLTDKTQSNLQKQIVTTLQGMSTAPDGSQLSHLSVFDLFDFADLDSSATLHLPELQFFTDVALESFKNDATDIIPELYDVGVVREALQLRHTQILEEAAKIPGSKQIDHDAVNIETDVVVGCLEARNRWSLAHKAKNEALHKYVDMIVGMVESTAMESVSRTQFVLHVLQIILPKLDTFIVEEAPEALELARAADSLLAVLAQHPLAQSQSRLDSIIAERLFQVFRICIEGIPLSGTSLELRTLLYSICSQYLARITTLDKFEPDKYRKACGSSMDCVRSSSQRLIGVLADDAEDGTDSCRLNALTLLGLLTALARNQKSNLVIESFVKANVVEVMLEPIRNISADFANTNVKQRPQLLVTTRTRVSLLIQISLSRTGAIALLDAGFIQALRDNNLFRADPDLGLGFEFGNKPTNNQSTLTPTSSSVTSLINYFTLLASMLRLLLSTFISRGPENEVIANIVRMFLSDHRSNMVGIFKKAAGVSGGFESKTLKDTIDECARHYTGLMVGCDFVRFEEEAIGSHELGRGNGGFT